jgi:hypothetical protein
MSVALERGGAEAAGPVLRAPVPTRRSWLARVWPRQPEPRVRFGQSLLPGYGSLGSGDAEAVRPMLRAAIDLSRRRATYEGLTIALSDFRTWEPASTPVAWLAAHHRLHAMWPLVVAGALSETPEVRERWYAIAASLVRAWLVSPAADAGGVVDRMVVSRRIVALLAFHECFEASLRADAELRAQVLRRLHREAGALSAHVAEMPADPWLIAAGRALFLAGRIFDGLDARQWQEQGADVVWTQLRAQVADDGGHTSRSPAWQAFVLEEYAHVVAVMAAAEEEIPSWAGKRLKGMCDVLWRTTHPDGTLVALGERAPRGWWSTAELVATVATLIAEPGIAPDGDLPGTLPRLLLPEQGRRVHLALPRRLARTESRAMRRTGLFVLGGPDGDAMVVDAGAPRRREQPFGYELALAGLPVVVSPWEGGAGGGRLGDYVASPRSQNVLADGRPSGVAAAPSAVGPDAHWMLRDGVASFVGSWGRQRRVVLCLPGRFWVVLDEMRGVGPWTGESLVHLHPATEVRVHANGRTVVDVARSRAARARIAFAGPREIRLIGGLLGPRPQGWLARGEGLPEPAPTVAVAVAGTLPICAGYALVPRTEQDVALDVTHEPLRIGAVLRVGRHAYHIDVLQDEIDVHTEVC